MDKVKGVEIDPVREKLIELLRKVQYQGNAVHGYHDKYIQNGELADHGYLCANGGEFCEAKVNFCPMCGRKLPEPPKGE